VENEGPMTQEEVAKFLGISKMRVSQIERIALKRFKKRCKLFLLKNPLLDILMIL
jgi:DNA-directed RNA polymerase sigma subunit (sigma70/sigma32)